MYHMPDGCPLWGAGYGYWGFAMWLILVLLIGILLFYTMRGERRSSGPTDAATPSRETPLEILKKRYARGEVSKDEFDRIRHDLE